MQRGLPTVNVSVLNLGGAGTPALAQGDMAAPLPCGQRGCN
jgi:hypothetical protein